MYPTMTDTVTVCYLCGQLVDASINSKDHVIPRTLLGKRPPKVRGFDYGGVLPTHPQCNNQFGDETHVRKALQLLGALGDANTTLVRPAPDNLNGCVLALNEEKLDGFSTRDFQFFRFHDARNDSMASFDDSEYYADKPHADIRKTVICTVLSVLTKSAAALLIKRNLGYVPSEWNVVCVRYAEDATRADLSSFFGVPKRFAEDIQVYTKQFEACSWVSIYTTSTARVFFFFLMDDDCEHVERIKKLFHLEECLRFQGESLMDLVGHDWPSVSIFRS